MLQYPWIVIYSSFAKIVGLTVNLKKIAPIRLNETKCID